MKILIAGSSGLIGTTLCKSLDQKGHEVTRLIRPSNSDKSDAMNGTLIWDPPREGLSEQDLSKQSLDVIINLCGVPVAPKRWTRARKELFYSSRVDTTALLAQNIASMKTPPKLFLNASAIGIYGDGGDKILEESEAVFDLNSASEYNFMANLCRDWEHALEPAAQVGIKTFSLRIGLVISETAKFLKAQKPLFKLGLGGWLGNPRSWLSWVSLTDVIGAMEFILENPDSFELDEHDKEKSNAPANIPINVVAPEPATAKDFAKAMGKAMSRPVIFRIPKLGPQLLMGRESVNALLQSARVVPKTLTSAGYEFRHPDVASAFGDIFRS